MDKEVVHILLIDDDEDDFVIVKDLLSDIKHTDFIVDWESTYDKGLEKIISEKYDVYLIDYLLGENNGLDLLKEAVKNGCKSPIIMLTGQGHPEVDYEAMRIGASDYMIKGVLDAPTIERSIRYALSHARTLVRLYDQEQKYHSLFEQSVSAIYITTKEHQFVDANPAMLNLFGYSREELLNLTLKSLFVTDQEFQNFLTKVKAGQVKDLEVLLKTKDGEELECNIKSTSLHQDGHTVMGFQGIIEDITERNEVQQELIRMEKLSMTGNIARSIAHEVRNPLTNINLALEQFATELPEDDTLDIYFDIIKRNTQRINQLITEMLNSSKPSQLSLECSSVNDILERSVQLAKDRTKLLEVELTKEYDQTIGEMMLDREKLNIAFLNIITNAIEAVEEGKGHIHIKTSQTDKSVQVMIADNGVGIEKSNLIRLFDAFHTGKRGGMGLGLTSTQNIINSHKAKINVESTLGKGTVFYITFDKEAEGIGSEEC